MKLFNSSKTHTIKIMALLTMVIAIAAVPTSASARGSIHLSLPHFSIGVHDNHHSNRGHNYRNSRRHNNYDYRSHGNQRYYNNNRHHNNFYTGYRYYQPRTRYYQPRYNDNYCPSSNYSNRYYDDRDCYSHGDHYHCEG